MRTTLNPPVFFTSAIFILLIVVATIIAPDAAGDLFSATQAWILTNASWTYILVLAHILLAEVFLAIIRSSDIKAGPDHRPHDHPDVTSVTMLLSKVVGRELLLFRVVQHGHQIFK